MKSLNKEAASLMDYNNKKSPRPDHAVNNVTFNDIDQDVIRIRDSQASNVQSPGTLDRKFEAKAVSKSLVRIKTFGISSNTSIHKLGNVLITIFVIT